MKIRFISLSINTETGGGSHMTLDIMLRYLLSQGHEVSLTTLYSDNKVRGAPYPIDCRSFSGNFLETQRFVCRILAEMSAHADFFILYGSSLAWGGGMYKKTGGTVPAAVYINNYTPAMGLVHADTQCMPLTKKFSLEAKRVIHNLKMRAWEIIWGFSYIRHVDAFLFDSPVIHKLYTQFGYRPANTFVIPEFMDVKAIQEHAVGSEPPFKKDPRLIHFFYNGRFTYDKGIDMLIEAVDSLGPLKNRLRIHVVGSGKQTAYIESLIQKRALKETVRLYSWTPQQELAAWYAHTDIFIHPCRWPEPFGRTIVEAMSLGKPVITSTDTGSAWAMDDGGITFKRNNKKDLADKIRYAIQHHSDMKLLGAKAKRRAEQFDYRIIGPELIRALCSIASAPKKN